MAAYAALASLMHIIKQIKDHPRPPFYLVDKHAQSLVQKVTFFQKFLEDDTHVRNELVDRLESRIAEAAYAAEDLIETHVVDQILAQSARHGKRICSVDFYQDLQKVIQDMDFIKNEVMEIKEKMGLVKKFQQYRRNLMPAAGSSRSCPIGQNNMVGCDDVLEDIVDKLTWPQRSRHREVIPIFGMGGIGKTTLAKNVYENPLIVQCFDVRAWTTVSQEYSAREVLLELLLCRENQGSQESLSKPSEVKLGDRLWKGLYGDINQDSLESLSKQSEVELRDRLRKGLYGRTYLVILDDMWNIEAWNKMKSSFPDNNNGSRVIITTRQSNVALDLTSGCRSNVIIEMKFLNDNISWNLLCKIVFGSEGDCPSELKKNGRKIAKNCNGLPLAIVVIGGLLAKSEKTPKYWKYIAKNLHSLEENEYCLNLLYTSYNHLPIHLKPCFLYMGIFSKGDVIRAGQLILLWVAEGFLKPISGKSLEEVAIEYLKDLADRNLILVVKRNYYNGDIASFKIHDLLRELCLRESQKDKFLLVTRQSGLNNSPQGINTKRRVAIYKSTLKEENQYNFLQICDALQSASLARTLVCNVEDLLFPNFRMLRILVTGFSVEENYSVKSYIFLVNLRLLVSDDEILVKARLPSSLYHFWNLQVLIFEKNEVNSFDIWKMPLLRLVWMKKLHLRNPGHDDFVLGNLQRLGFVANFRCSEKMVKRIPNIKDLDIRYDGKRFIGSRYCLNNLARLYNLEAIYLQFHEEMPSRSELLQNLTFPHSLKILLLMGCGLHWEDISTKIGSLPLLEVLHLQGKSFIGPKWETIEGQFHSLRILWIENCDDLKCWETDSTHFPRLERLRLIYLGELEEIPSAIGHISTLQKIRLKHCGHSAVISAKEIAKEQEELENHDLHVRVKVSPSEYEKMKSWASPNFEVREDNEENGLKVEVIVVNAAIGVTPDD